MALITGIALGPYEIISPLGAGGMGEVYRARDTRLGRDVAIKILSAAFSKDAELLRRFEQEARAAGILNHPNILVIYDIGTHDGSPYVVSELLEGETLRERLNSKAISPRKAIEYALQIAHGLAAAHEKGIVHRDLKPENIFVTGDGRIKILDFGLAKLIHPQFAASLQTEAPTMRNKTEPGAIMGTVGYMSPEQVRGQTVDRRSDIFSFGVIFFEMLAGKRPFQCESAVETMNAILKDDPPELNATNRVIPPAIEQLVEHCLEKKPDDRFQSVKDLIFALDALSGISTINSSPPMSLSSMPLSSMIDTPVRNEISSQSTLPATDGYASQRAAQRATKRPRRGFLFLVILLLLLATNITTFIIGQHTAEQIPLAFRRLTFRRGAIRNARFGPDNNTIVYDAAWDGKGLEVFSARPDSPESRSLGFPENTSISGISSTGEMAIVLNSGRIFGPSLGTFARVPLAGGAPREIVENVFSVEWSPDGANFMLFRQVDNQPQIEYPAGKVIYRTSKFIAYPRLSPDGQKVAFMEWPELSDGTTVGSVCTVDQAGNKTVLYTGWLRLSGLAWSPKGDEVWFAAPEDGGARAIHAISMNKRDRLVTRMAGALTLQDVSRDGHVLLTRELTKVEILGLPPGETKERALSWLDESAIAALSNDGKTMLFTEIGEGGGSSHAVYLRKTDGSPAVRLGDGRAMALSPDGKWALAITENETRKIIILPTGAGETREINFGNYEHYIFATWFPDGKRILFTANEPGKARRTYVYNLESNQAQPLTPEGTIGALLAPDGRSMIIAKPDNRRFIYSIDNGQMQELTQIDTIDRPLRWTEDGQAIFFSHVENGGIKIYQLDLKTSIKKPWLDLLPPDPAGINAIMNIQITPDGKSYAYSYRRLFCDLYLIDGLK